MIQGVKGSRIPVKGKTVRTSEINTLTLESLNPFFIIDSMNGNAGIFL